MKYGEVFKENVTRDVNSGLRRAQRLFWAVPAAGVVGLLLCFPRWSDAEELRALRQLDALEGQLDMAAVARALERQAEIGASPALEVVASEIAGEGVESVAAADGLAEVFRAVPVQVDSLEQVIARSAGEQPLSVVGPEMDPLQQALRWRLARQSDPRLTLTSLELVGVTGQAQLEAERAVEPLRLSAAEELRKFAELQQVHEELRERAKELWKADAPKKLQWKAYGERREAYAEMDAQRQAMEAALARYEQSAAEALALEPTPLPESGPPPDAPGVVVEATFQRSDGEPVTLRVAAPRVRRKLISQQLPIPPQLSALRSLSVWPELAPLDLKAAREHLRDGLSWHASGRDLGLIRAGGATLLHAYPLLLLVLLALLHRQCRAVHDAYSPFKHPGNTLPPLGSGQRVVDLALLVAPVALVVIISAWALGRLRAGAWLEIVLGVPVVVYAAQVSRSWDDLKRLRMDIVRTSLPPLLQT